MGRGYNQGPSFVGYFPFLLLHNVLPLSTVHVWSGSVWGGDGGVLYHLRKVDSWDDIDSVGLRVQNLWPLRNS